MISLLRLLFFQAGCVRRCGAFNQHSVGRLGLRTRQDRTPGDNSGARGKDRRGDNAVLNPEALETARTQREKQIHYKNYTEWCSYLLACIETTGVD